MSQIGDEEPRATEQEDLGVEVESDIIDVRDDVEAEQPLPDASDEQRAVIDFAGLDNLLDGFVEVVNARDLDRLSELLSPEAEASFLGEFSESGVVDGFNDLLLRYPTFMVTRGDIGSEPIAVAWIFDQEADRFDPFGYFTLDVTDSEEPQIQRVEYAEELPASEDLVVETPERSELPEWEDWSALDED